MNLERDLDLGTHLGLGVGWRPELALAIDRRPDVGFVEILAENVDPRRPLPAPLRRLRERGVRIVVHSIGLSLGGAAPVDRRRLDRLARVAEWAGAVCVSDHVAFVRAGGRGTGHLLPVPRTEAALAVLCDNVAQARRVLPVPLALENIATLFDWPGNTFDEPALLTRLTAETGALLVLDVSNLYANARNLGFDGGAWLARAPLARIAYAHVGGGVARNGLWHDTHAHAVPPESLALLRQLRREAPLPGVLLERDDRFPPAAELDAELDAIAGAAELEVAPVALPSPAPPAPAPPAPASDRRALAVDQHALVGALMAGEAVPRGFDARLLEAEAQMLAAKRLRAAGRAWPRLDLEGAHRARFLAWARANPLAEADCGWEDGRRFRASL
ncbi:MAG TPA: DUF692 domain-containing protein [Polyangia bacterium]|jgi:hypothetical protein